MKNTWISALIMSAVAISGCDKDVSFKLDAVSESEFSSQDSDDVFFTCYLKVYATNNLEYGVKIGPQITVFTDSGAHKFRIDSWGDDWEYLIANDEGEGSPKRLYFREDNVHPMSCAKLAQAINRKAFTLELNRCEKIDQTPASCDVDLEVASGGVELHNVQERQLQSLQRKLQENVDSTIRS
ncbi:hypothetical protein [uncultured Shewanella sp.]|uniref:hypothetical protein n=1 Tax=Shewanella atlantica TaxID=271099 RepID=UPI0026088FEF|nr:hypothetical protein [uncultured Shewanella sp.]